MELDSLCERNRYDRLMQATATWRAPEGHYEQLVRRQRAELQDAYLKGVRRLRWDAGRLAAERERRLRELLVYAADRSPFWRERLAGRDLANFTESDLPSLPILTRAEMMAEFDRVVTVPGLTLARVQQHVDSVERRPVPGRRVPGNRHVWIYRNRSIPCLRLGRVRHLRDAGLALDRATRRRPGRGAGAVLQLPAPGMSRGYFTPSAASKAEGRHRTAPAARYPWTRSSTASTTSVLRCRLSKGGRASSGSWL